MPLKVLQFCAIVLTALALVPAGAHLFELPNKIGLPQERYFTVQAIYRGWALFGFVLVPAIAADLALAVVLRRGGGAPFRLATLAALCMVASLAVFFVWTRPANSATDNWTVAPANWEALRARWEYSHAANAVATFVALCSLTLATLMSRK